MLCVPSWKISKPLQTQGYTLVTETYNCSEDLKAAWVSRGTHGLLYILSTVNASSSGVKHCSTFSQQTTLLLPFLFKNIFECPHSAIEFVFWVEKEALRLPKTLVLFFVRNTKYVHWLNFLSYYCQLLPRLCNTLKGCIFYKLLSFRSKELSY